MMVRLTLLIGLLTLLPPSSLAAGRKGCAGSYAKIREPAGAGYAENAWQKAIAGLGGKRSSAADLRRVIAILNDPKKSEAKIFGQLTSSVELNVKPGSGVKIYPRYDPKKPAKGIIIQIDAGAEDLKNPLSVGVIVNHLLGLHGEDSAEIFGTFDDFNGYASEGFGGIYGWAENAMNAENGSRLAKARQSISEINTRMEALDAAENGDRGTLFDKIDKNAIHQAKLDYVNAVKPVLEKNVAIVREELARKTQVLKDFAKKGPIADLAPLVAANDRAGAAKLISANLPWDEMEPSEKRYWQAYLKAIEHPSKDRSLLFRGYSGQAQLRNGDGQPYSFSPVFSEEREQTNDDKDLRKARKLYTNLVAGMGSSDMDGGRILPAKSRRAVSGSSSEVTDMMEGGLKHLSLNTSYDPWLSFTFAKEGKNMSIGAYAIDNDRAILNLTSPYIEEGGQAEREVLAPFMLFPDEAVVYHEGTFKNEKTAYAQFLKEVKEKAKKEKVHLLTDDEAVQQGVGKFAKDIGLWDGN